jgi:hypothetical protein
MNTFDGKDDIIFIKDGKIDIIKDFELDFEFRVASTGPDQGYGWLKGILVNDEVN